MMLHVISGEEPYASIVLRHLRDKNTPPPVFREWLRRAGFLLGVKAARFLPKRSVNVETPLGIASELEPGSLPLVVSVLGAGHFLAEGVLEAYPGAPLGFVAARRVEAEGDVSVEVTYVRLPNRWEGPAIIADPMLATGLTASKVAGILLERGAKPVIIASVIAAPEGVKRIGEMRGDIAILALALDERLDSRFFIVPGLGDAGDRSLGVSV